MEATLVFSQISLSVIQMEPFSLGMGEYPYQVLVSGRYRAHSTWVVLVTLLTDTQGKKKKSNLYQVVLAEHGGALQHQRLSSCLDKQPGNVADFGIAERKLGKIKVARGSLKSSSF